MDLLDFRLQKRFPTTFCTSQQEKFQEVTLYETGEKLTVLMWSLKWCRSCANKHVYSSLSLSCGATNLMLKSH